MLTNIYHDHEREATSIGLSVPEIVSELSSVYIDTLPVVKMGEHSKEMTPEEKKLIKSMIEAGSKAADVCKLLCRSKSTVSKFIKRFSERGDVENGKCSGPPKKVNDCGL